MVDRYSQRYCDVPHVHVLTIVSRIATPCHCQKLHHLISSQTSTSPSQSIQQHHMAPCHTPNKATQIQPITSTTPIPSNHHRHPANNLTQLPLQTTSNLLKAAKLDRCWTPTKSYRFLRDTSASAMLVHTKLSTKLHQATQAFTGLAQGSSRGVRIV